MFISIFNLSTIKLTANMHSNINCRQRAHPAFHCDLADLFSDDSAPHIFDSFQNIKLVFSKKHWLCLKFETDCIADSSGCVKVNVLSYLYAFAPFLFAAAANAKAQKWRFSSLTLKTFIPSLKKSGKKPNCR